MCTNPMCVNFGWLYGSEDEPRPQVKSCYKIEVSGKTVTLRCRTCGQSQTLHAPLSIRPIARRFLAQSLPFSTCPDEDCANCGVNVFEHFDEKFDGTSRRRYRVRKAEEGKPSRVRCGQCGKDFALGHAINMADHPGNRSFLRKLVEAVQMGLPPTKALELTAREIEVDGDENEALRRTGKYYRSLGSLSAVLRDYHAWRNAFLLSPDFRALQTEPVKVYTDALDVSLDRIGVGPPFKSLKILVSVVNLRKSRNTHFILAAHPYFLPDSELPDDVFASLAREKQTPHILGRRWEGLESILDERPLFEKGKVVGNPPTQGYGGYILKPPYPQVAHFLTVDRMLSGFPERHYYLDGDQLQAQAALVAMRRQVRDKSVQIALFQHKDRHKSRQTSENREAADFWAPPTLERLRTAYEPVEQEFRRKVACAPAGSAERELLPINLGTDAAWQARTWRQGCGGANSEEGAWAWLRFPPKRKKYKRCRTFWLTRRPGDGFEDGAGLLLDTTLIPVDANHSYMRDLVPSAHKPPRGATGRTDYVDSPFLPSVVGAYFALYLFLRNYKHRKTERKKDSRAKVMGLVPEGRPVLTIEDAIWSFRLNRAHAEEITAWLNACQR